ncbi:heterogeneous nuclear ribonucleoprotein Q isoform X2 [Folsomia candida]|uniref:heterogeneous nuclear ribonucleoprotein Q isoform X2 n=1 Tax=Folsomia candida TaxID=158441 RepID=UPI00160542CE|nr:heterogeneous nuclear ribonucleoprotein Q isoform X2 [Folsomia candida]
MASGNGDLSGLTDEVTDGPVETGKVDATGGGDTFNSSTTSTPSESVEPLKIPADQRSADYQKLIQYGLDEKVSAKLDDIYNTGKLAHSDLDERALDALKEFPVDGALTVLKQFLDSNLEHVSNKSAYLCGVMKTYRQKSRTTLTASQGGSPTGSPVKGPDEAKIKAILERTGYSLDVTTGQRKYGGPPPSWEGIPPGNGCEVFCGKIPKDMYEDELIPLFEKCGGIWDLRLMMDPMTGLNRGYAFVTFMNKDGAQEAVRQLNEFEIRKGKKIGVTISYNNHRLFVGNIPKNRDHDELVEEFSKHAPGLTEVIIYSSPDDRKKNRGFCFLEYESHKAASLAKRRLGTSRVKVWGCDIIVDWADPQEEPDDETMSKVKVLYVRNLTQDVAEERLKEQFEQFGKVERVKKIKDYAFVHFEERDGAVKAMDELNGKDVGGSLIEISLAKPPSDKKKKEEILRARERRMMQMIATRPPPYVDMLPPLAVGGGGRGRGGMRGGHMGRTDFEYQIGFNPSYLDFSSHPRNRNTASDHNPEFGSRYGNERHRGYNNSRVSGSASSHILQNDMYSGYSSSYRRNNNNNDHGSRDFLTSAGWAWPWDSAWSRAGNGTAGRWADGAGDAWNGTGGAAGWGSAFRAPTGPAAAIPWTWNPTSRSGFATGNGWSHRPGEQRQQKQRTQGKFSTKDQR